MARKTSSKRTETDEPKTSKSSKKTSKKKSTKKASTSKASTKKASTSRKPPEPMPAQGGAMAEHTNGDGAELSVEELRKIKSGLSKKEIDGFRQMLLEKRAEIVGDVESLQTDARNTEGGISYEHMADTGTDNYEQEFTLGLVESERALLREIDEALDRISAGIYGVCIVSGQPIPKARLEIKPWAKYCIEVARDRERRGLE